MTTASDRALIVLSGGQDSTTALFWALNRYNSVRAITFDYAQVHKRELQCAREIARRAGVAHDVLSIGIFEQCGLSSLVQKGQPSSHKNLPSTFVPGRNIIFLTYAAVVAFKHGILDIVAGMSQIDYSGYPDCRDETMRSLEQTLRCGMDSPIRIVTPLMQLSKSEIVTMACEEGCYEMMGLTHTCYAGKHPPCGQCDACRLRAAGFARTGFTDPLIADTSPPCK